MLALRIVRMSAESTLRRILHLQSILDVNHGRNGYLRLLATSSDGGKYVQIGDISKEIRVPNNPELVPTKYLPAETPQSILRHLRWIMQKDLLGQDVFLIGAPGPLRRQIAMMYLELTQREAEYVSLSRDTTETDLKQRREIKAGTAFHIDQCAVKAATKGRILILEGIEKAERNVLPVLNNLLENREMQLDDGRFLMAADRYDKLLQEHSKEEMDQWKIVRVDENFRVIALGLPVPRYKGNPLDPPLRSRFQARDIHPLPFKDQLEFLNAFGAKVPPEKVSQMLSFALTMKSEESHGLGLPDFPTDNLHAIVQILNEVPQVSPYNLLKRLYPYEIMLGKEGRSSAEDAFKNFELLKKEELPSAMVTEVRRSQDFAEAEITINGSTSHIQVPAGSLQEVPATSHFVQTPFHDQLLADIVQSHMTKDFCIIGSRGCGKSVLIKQFADLFGYHIEPIMLYQDMTSRDLLQQRMTLPNGDTAWRPSPLVTAALEGSLAVLDGVHRVNPGTFAVLHRLIHDRELSLFDGTRLLSKDRFDDIKEKHQLSDQDMNDRGVFAIHPAFRIVALSEPPVIGSSTQQWLNSELLTMFLYHHMRSLSREEELQVLHKLVPDLSNIAPIMNLTQALRQSGDSNLKSVATSFSTRQLLRIARRMSHYPQESAYDAIHKASLSRFLPRIAKNALEDELLQMDIQKPEAISSVEGLEKAITCEIKDGNLRIGNTEVAIYNPENRMKVPDVLFYENPQHLAIMEDMLKDFMLGEHLLLVGNQGVGKNKIVDRFLFLLNRPREYLQLHRDTTVQTLTLQPTVQDGVIIYEDSPLVRAVKNGHILVVDEADKAPTNVTCILKTLVESGEMHLADGRRIVSATSGIKPSSQVIVAHPEFRMMVLANRPGFPFLGNDFFGAMGDIFSAHAVDNPDPESEMSMLRQYGPNVPEDTLRKLVLAFGELRDMADQGQITYPYSTREVVNMVRHLEKFPEEGLSSVVKNVFDFDSYNKELTETVIQTLHKHGIPVGAHPGNVSLAKEYELPKFELGGQIQVKRQGSKSKLFDCPVQQKNISIKGPVKMNVQSFPLEKTEARSLLFSEQESYWTIPMHETGVIMDITVSRADTRQPGQYNDDIVHIATGNPISLYSMNPRKQHLTCIDLYDIFPHMRSHFRPKVKIGVLGFPLDSNVVLLEGMTNTLLNINTETGEVSRLDMMTTLESATEKITRHFKEQVGNFKMCTQLAHLPEGLVVFYKEGSESLDVMNMLEGHCHTVSFPIKLQDLHMLSRSDWLLTEMDTSRKYMLSQPQGTRFEYTLQPITESEKDLMGTLEVAGREPLHDALMSAALEQKITSPNRAYTTKENIATIAVGLPDLSDADIYHCKRVEEYSPSLPGYIQERLAYASRPVAKKKEELPLPTVLLPESGQVVRAVPTWHAPSDLWEDGKKPAALSGYLEVADIVNHKLRYIPVPGVIDPNPYTSWMYNHHQVKLCMAEMSNDGVVTIDQGGCVRLWETALTHLEESLRKWRGLIGEGEKTLQITYERQLTQQVTQPKHGRVDPTGAPHVGGGTWAGGTGGANTAGLGGVGGPYRLDSGGPVYQVPQVDKDNVPEEVKRAAREMGQKAFKERLKQIKMSEYDAELYERFSGNVRRQVQSLRVIMDSLQAKGKERQWLKHQTHGDLDEAKLIEGLTGERSIYKRRGEKEPELGSPQQKPKLVRLLVDVSGSMYRFNGHDGRLDRQMESMVMVMEALDKYEHKIKYDIIGHSGEGYNFEIVHRNKPPANNKERLDAVKTLHAHAQFCISGDHTLEAAEHAIKTIVDEEADEHFVILMSDANLDRYGIRPKKFGQVLTSNDDVNAYVVFIGSLGDQAHRFVKQMPAGRAFLCMETKNLPMILQQIFTSTMLDAR